MMTAQDRPFTIEDFKKLPEFRPPFEYWCGRVVQKMSSGLPRCNLQEELQAAINAHARPLKLGRAHSGLRCDFEGHSLIFDLCYYVEARRPRLATVKGATVGITPDLAIEILSPGQAVGELSKKLHSAIREGVRQGWILVPNKRRIWVFRSVGPAELLAVGDVLVAEDIIPGFSLTVEQIFRWLDED